MTWNSAWQGFKEKPILGYGNENFYVVFNKYFNPEIYRHAGSRIWFDRAHNIFIDHLITGGIIGLLLYSVFIIGPTWLLIRRCRRRPDEESDNKDKFNFSDQILALAIITFIIQGLLVFEALVTYMPLLIILAFISQRYIKHRHSFFNRKVILGSIIVYIIALVPIMYIVNIKEARASLTVIKALHLQNVNIDQSLDTYFEAINYRASSSHEFRRRVAEYADGLIVNRMLTLEKALAVAEKIDKELRMRFEENPRDVANYMLAMRHYNYTYILDPSRLFEVAKIGELAIAYSPTRPHIYYEIGYADLYLYQWFRDQGLTEEAKIYQKSVIKNFDKAIELNDDVRESYVNMLMVLLASDQSDKIPPYIDILIDKQIWPVKISPQDLTRLMRAAVNARNFEWAIYFMQLAIDDDTHNPDNYVALALSYANLDMNEEAIATAERIKEFGGTYLQQAEEFIIKIRNGTFVKEADR